MKIKDIKHDGLNEYLDSPHCTGSGTKREVFERRVILEEACVAFLAGRISGIREAHESFNSILDAFKDKP